MVFEEQGSERVARALDPVDETSALAAVRSIRSEDADLGLTIGEIGIVLDRTRSNRVRNAAAVVLADRNAEGTAERLLALMTSPEIAKAAGTLLFALDELGGELTPEAFLNLIAHGSYEARAEALAFIAEDRVTVGNARSDRDLIEKLQGFATGSDPDAAHAAFEALEQIRRRLTPQVSF